MARIKSTKTVSMSFREYVDGIHENEKQKLKLKNALKKAYHALLYYRDSASFACDETHTDARSVPYESFKTGRQAADAITEVEKFI